MNTFIHNTLMAALTFGFAHNVVGQIESESVEPNTRALVRKTQDESLGLALDFRPGARIGGVVRAIFEDSKGVLWIGGEGDLFRIDNDAVTSFRLKDTAGNGVTVKQIVEDREGVLWCGTTGGITKIDGATFTSLGQEDGLVDSDVWSLAASKDGALWVGTIGGVYRFDGVSFTKFDIPKSKPDPTRGVTSAEIVHCILVDSQDRVWFGTNGGAYVYDGTNLTRISQQNGLPGEVVHNMTEAADGSVWMGTTHNGICRFDGVGSVNFTADGTVEGDEIWCIHEDREGNIWFSGKHLGVYRYGGSSFKRFDKNDGMDSAGMMCIFHDSNDRLWLGGVGGLFRFREGKFLQVTESGPWR